MKPPALFCAGGKLAKLLFPADMKRSHVSSAILVILTVDGLDWNRCNNNTDADVRFCGHQRTVDGNCWSIIKKNNSQKSQPGPTINPKKA